MYRSVGRSAICDPMLLKDIEPAVRRIREARERGERVAVYGDYDADGITSSCLLYDYLTDYGLDCVLYIPDRLVEGYGLNIAAIDSLREQGVTLIVTVDCGVTAVNETAYAKETGVDMIITDHHECRAELPDAVAVIDPKRPDCKYPNKELAGVGVAFKLVCAIDGDGERVAREFCDLVAVGTVADVMPLVEENHEIVKQGITKLLENPRPGFAGLIDEAGLATKKLGASSIGFVLAPRLNAAGRLGRVELAVQLLLSRDAAEAHSLASELCDLNRRRQDLESEIWDSPLKMVEGAPKTPIVLASESWHQGVIGIAASRLTEVYGVPAIMICLEGDSGRGSCRSYGDFNIFEALEACSELLEGFGGHFFAAGLTIKRENIDEFRRAIGEYYLAHPPEHGPVLELDLEIDDPELLNMDCVDDLETLEPCGNGNPRPLMCMTDAAVDSVVPLGGGKHSKLRVRKFGRDFECVFFSRSPERLNIRGGDHIDFAFRPQINKFRGHSSIQLVLSDLRHSDELPLCEDILSGSVPLDQGRRLLPIRRDFAAVWRCIESYGSIEGNAGEIAELLSQSCSGIGSARACVCVKIFEELGLLSVARTQDRYRITALSPETKVDLNTSRLLRRLR